MWTTSEVLPLPQFASCAICPALPTSVHHYIKYVTFSSIIRIIALTFGEALAFFMPSSIDFGVGALKAWCLNGQNATVTPTGLSRANSATDVICPAKS